MPAPIGIPCDLCGKKFFKRSLPIHRKQCEKKFALCYSECPKCLRRVSNDEFEKHVSECTVVRKKLPKRAKVEQKTCQYCKKSMPAETYTPHLEACSKAIEARNNGESDEDSSSDEEDCRQECGFCNRKFSPERIAKHEQICSVNAARKPRKEFKSAAAMRLAGTDFEKYVKNRREVEKPASRWRNEHQRLQGMVEQGRLVAEFQKENIPLTELPNPGTNLKAIIQGMDPSLAQSGGEKQVPEGMERCPYCERTFSLEAAAKHIPKCKTTKNRPKRLERKSKPVLHQPKKSFKDQILAAIKRVVETKQKKNSYYQTKEASMFKEDDPVLMKDGRKGVVKFIGRVNELHPGYWIGVALETASGHNDGTIQQSRYFHCNSNHGVFVRPTNLKREVIEILKPEIKEEEEPKEEVKKSIKPVKTGELPKPTKQDKPKRASKPDAKRKPNSMVDRLRKEVRENSNEENTVPQTQNTEYQNKAAAAKRAKDKRISKDVKLLEQIHGKMNKGERGFGGGVLKSNGSALGKGNKLAGTQKKAKSATDPRAARAAYFAKKFGANEQE